MSNVSIPILGAKQTDSIVESNSSSCGDSSIPSEQLTVAQPHQQNSPPPPIAEYISSDFPIFVLLTLYLALKLMPKVKRCKHYSRMVLISRKRINLQPPGVHNPWGRKGTLGCEECRRRRRKVFQFYIRLVNKCVYTHELLPCDFCRRRNSKTVCIKIPAAKVADPSRQIPTAMDAVVDSQDVLILSYAYSNHGRPTRLQGVNAFIKILGAQFGPSLVDPSLRHAVIALTTAGLPREQFGQALVDHKQKAWVALGTQLRRDRISSTASIFATFVLMLLDRDSKDPGYRETARKCKMMLSFITENEKYVPLFDIFHGYISDCLDCEEMTRSCLDLDGAAAWILPSSTTLKQRMQYYTEFRRIDSRFRLGELEALDLTSCYLLERSICCVYRAILKEADGSVFVGDSFLQIAFQQLCSELRDLELHISEFQGLIPAHSVVHMTQRLDCIRLAISLLNAPSIFWGMNTDEAISYAKILAESLQKHPPRMRELLTPFMKTILRAEILLVGLVLPVEDVQKCTLPPSRC